MSNVLFVCLHNAGRSQMSQAWFERISDGRHEARSAGTEPSTRVYPYVVEVMEEKGIDLSRRVPQRLTSELTQWADIVVTMGCGDACPVIPGRRYIDWDLRDPNDMSLVEVRQLRDEIQARTARLVKELDRVALGG